MDLLKSVVGALLARCLGQGLLLLLLGLKIIRFTLISTDDEKFLVVRADTGVPPALLWLSHLVTCATALVGQAAKDKLHVLPYQRLLLLLKIQVLHFETETYAFFKLSFKFIFKITEQIMLHYTGQKYI